MTVRVIAARQHVYGCARHPDWLTRRWRDRVSQQMSLCSKHNANTSWIVKCVFVINWMYE